MKHLIQNVIATLKTEKLSFLYIVFGALLASGIATVSAQWTGNNSTPPANNVDAPLNVSVSKQEKKGPIWANTLSNAPIGLVVFGQAQIRGGTPGIGKVLTSVDEEGTAAWSSLSEASQIEYETCTQQQSGYIGPAGGAPAAIDCIASCSAGKQVIGGACSVTTGGGTVRADEPTEDGDGWVCEASTTVAGGTGIKGIAICQ